MTEAVQYINGQWLAGEGEPFASLDPAKNEVIWRGAAAGPEQVAAPRQITSYLAGPRERIF
ncbi:hypothetical protein, partial [Zobellella denitrificans]|uniref:hypothetical protein n=1 Tax=Zobellella denitrificans TaxID=347534 RepID=UPI00115D719E